MARTMRESGRSIIAVLCAVALIAAGSAFLLQEEERAAAIVGDPYSVPTVVDVNPDPNIVETTIIANEATLDTGGGVMADVYAYNGSVPGPEFRLTPGQRVIVHFQNLLDDEPTGIHWHGIELANNSDGTSLSQNQTAPGDSYLYDFVAPRPGIYWYHPHHEFSTNQVFKGLYGSIIVTDPNASQLIADGVLPSASQTRTLALSDVTVCKEPGSNDSQTYDLTLPWAGGSPLPAQSSPTPDDLCDTPIDNHGDPLGAALPAGSVPNIQKHSGRVNEGQTVLTNGVNVGGRAGDPAAPGALAAGAHTLAVQPGQGLRLQIGNTATTRFFRLRLTESDGTQIPLVRVGGEGGLLDDAVLDGTQPAGFDFRYASGEILLDPGDRADVVAAFPDDATGVATLWTLDFQRAGGGDGAGGWTRTPTVPVAHFNVTGAAVSPAFSIAAGTALRSATGDPVDVLPAATGTLLDPTTFTPPKPGNPSQNIQLTANGATPSIDSTPGPHDFSVDYTQFPVAATARYAKLGDTLELQVTNTTQANHPFHLHGFSIQPLSFTNCTDNGGTPLPVPTFNFPEHEFMDNLDVPPKCTLTYRVKIEDRPLADGTTPGGGLGRWVFHCHIFFHHHQGMTSELIVTDADGNERPYVDADDTAVTVSEGTEATMDGTFSDPDGDAVTLSASVGTVTDNGDGTWSWAFTPPDGPSASNVFVTATDANGNTSQATFALQADNVPPTVTIDPSQVTVIDEGDTLSVLANFTDPGDDDPYTATIDFDTGLGAQPATVALTTSTPPQAGTVSGTLQYGDNGSFHVTVTVTDKDGASGSAAFDVTVNNVDPTATISTPAPVVADVNVAVALNADATDPGSDDLTTTWDFDDGAPSPDESTTSLVDPPGTDPPESPSVEPRNVSDPTSHAFALACAYDVVFAATDDDGGTGSDSVLVIITAPPTRDRNSGYWQHQYGGQGAIDFSTQQLQCYLDIVNALSTVFSETTALVTFANAYTVIYLGNASGTPIQQLERQILVAWLNFANGAVEYNELIDTNKNGIPDTAFSTVMATAESVRLNPASTKKQLQDQANILKLVNDGG
jgi:FtsP/CotA-like multicopper oxidase with cupredoxin domain